MNNKQSNQSNNNSSEYLSDTLIDYLKKLQQENWYDLTATFREPLSSILPKLREVDEKEIYDNYKLESIVKKLTGSPSSNISVNGIREWLNQFETYLDKNIAYLLLKEFQFFSEDSIKSSVENLRNKLLNYLIHREQLENIFNSLENPSEKTEIKFKRWLQSKVIRYAWLPLDDCESQYQLWSYYETNALDGSESSCPSVSKPKSLEDYFKGEYYNSDKVTPQSTVFVFMDYTNATGSQLSKCISKINSLLGKYPKWKDSFFIFLYVVESKIIDKKNLDSKFTANNNWQTIADHTMLDYKDEKIINLLSHYHITEEEYDNFIQKYCERSGNKSIGYHNHAFLTCTHRSCPNNTLSFFQKSSSQEWNTMFQNSQVRSSIPYRQKEKELGIADFEYDLYLVRITKLFNYCYFELLDFYPHTLIQQRHFTVLFYNILLQFSNAVF